uniref:Cilia- and flagella-associated protein 97 n=1 Tax=Glossina morsitans morsitans TaxID=37546 RepID=A0A1B0F9Q7_GLOMM
MSDAIDSDDERYANASFENDTDEEIPEMTDLESETENSGNEDDALPSAKANAVNGNYIHRLSKRISSTRKYGYSNRRMGNNSSSEEENDATVNKTQEEIATEAMCFDEDLPQASKTGSYGNGYNLEQRNTTEYCTEDDDEDYKQIEVMESRYKKFMKQNSVVANAEAIEQNDMCSEEDEVSETFEESEMEDDKGSREEYFEQEELGDEEELSKSERQTSRSGCNNYAGTNNSIQANQSFPPTNIIRMLQESLHKMKASEEDLLPTNDILHPAELNVPLPIDFEHINIPNSQEIAMALMDAVKTTILENSNEETIRQSAGNANNIKSNNEQDINSGQGLACDSVKDNQTPRCLEQMKTEDPEEEQVKEIVRPNSKIESVDMADMDDDMSEAQMNFCHPICSYNSDESLFKRGFYKEIQTSSTEKVKATSQNRKSWSFSNERMREIERHNRILLRKILSQKPTYTMNSQQKLQHKMTTSPYPNTRVSSAAVNRKKQQRQIDLDNQVLKRKIEAISLRRGPMRP